MTRPLESNTGRTPDARGRGSLTLLTTALLRDRTIVRQVDQLAAALELSFGWHYLLDFVWTIQELRRQGIAPGSTVLDAGAGTGLLQFLLASMGYEVLSVDFAPRKPTRRMCTAFDLTQVQAKNEFAHTYIDHLKQYDKETAPPTMLRRGRAYVRHRVRELVARPRLMSLRRHAAPIRWYTSDMCDMTDISAGSVDAVVSISAIEHLDVESMPAAVSEFRRVLKPGGRIVVTTSAAEGESWYHAPSKGHCLSRLHLADLFGLDRNTPWGDFAAAMRVLEEGGELKQRLAHFYFESGNNGMPWGNWAPQYVPVGVVSGT